MTLFIIQSQTGEFLDRNLAWVTDAHPTALFQTPHRDVALNQLIELNAKNINLRARVITCDANDRGQPDMTFVAA